MNSLVKNEKFSCCQTNIWNTQPWRSGWQPKSKKCDDDQENDLCVQSQHPGMTRSPMVIARSSSKCWKSVADTGTDTQYPLIPKSEQRKSWEIPQKLKCSRIVRNYHLIHTKRITTTLRIVQINQISHSTDSNEINR